MDGGRLDDGTKTATGARLKFEDPGGSKFHCIEKLWRAARGCTMCIVIGHMLFIYSFYDTLDY